MKNIKYFTYILLTLLLSFNGVQAQVTKHNTKIKDGSVSNSSAVPNSNAILELESTAKGFLLPRMTDAQRNELTSKLNEDGNGVAIYNTSTDCINYWSKMQNEWLSLCGALPPATIDLNQALCSSIKITPADGNSLVQGKFLSPQDILFVDLNVTSIGIYEISATTENGYYFSASGTFMNTGNMRIALHGVGTPLKGYDAPPSGDVVTFNINGKKAASQCAFKSFVKKAAIDFDIVCTSGTFEAKGKYLIGIPVKQNENYVDVIVNVKSPGAYNIKSTAFNGVSFNGSGVFDKAEANKTVRLYAEGVPTASAVGQALTIETNSNNKPNSSCTIKLSVQAVDYTVDLSKSTAKGEFLQGSKLSDQTITIPVQVISPGIANFKLESAGVTFAASNVRLELKEGTNESRIQYVTLINDNSNLPLQEKLIISGPINDNKFKNTFEISLKERPVEFSVLCESVKINDQKSIFSPGIAMDEDNFISLTVQVKSKGSYEIKTNVVNGVSFYAKGNFEGSGTFDIKLQGNGTPEYPINNAQYFITTNNADQSVVPCSFKINYKYYDINILVIGSKAYGPSTDQNYTQSKILNTQSNFGPSGKVKVNSINYHNVSSYADGRKLGTDILQKKIDIVLIVYSGRVSGTAEEVLSNFIINTKGVVVYAVENNQTQFMSFIKKLDHTTQSIRFNSSYTMTNPIVSNVPDQIADGSFGSLKGKRLGNDATNGHYFSILGANMLPIATRDMEPDWVWAAMHKEHGFIFVGDGGWMMGNLKNTSNSIYPAVADFLGNPIPKYDYGNRNSNGTVYNSLFFANVMEWGINYVLKNKKRE